MLSYYGFIALILVVTGLDLFAFIVNYCTLQGYIEVHCFINPYSSDFIYRIYDLLDY